MLTKYDTLVDLEPEDFSLSVKQGIARLQRTVPHIAGMSQTSCFQSRLVPCPHTLPVLLLEFAVNEVVNFFKNIRSVGAHKIDVEIETWLSHGSFDQFQFEQNGV